jgi:hypothetical protein
VNLLAIAINYDKSLNNAYYVSEVQRVHAYGIEHDQLCLYVANITFAHSL